MALTSVMAVCYNLVHSAMIKRTSAVTTTVIGEVKIVGLMLLSALLLGESSAFTPKMFLGCGLAIAVFVIRYCRCPRVMSEVLTARPDAVGRKMH
jgi:hypothetical protein